VNWQVQEAKQRFSELLRAARSDGPQVVTRHGEEIAVVIDITEWHRMRGSSIDFKEYLRAGPAFDDLDLSRPVEYARDIDLGHEG
jgi:prevent-host-death family protein